MTFHNHKGRIGKVGGSLKRLKRGAGQQKPKKDNIEKKRITRRGKKSRRLQSQISGEIGLLTDKSKSNSRKRKTKKRDRLKGGESNLLGQIQKSIFD